MTNSRGKRQADDSYRRAKIEMRKSKPNLGLLWELFNESAANDNAEAVYAVASWYLHGVPPYAKKDIAKGIKLLQKAANAEIPDALYDLAIAYEKGDGVELDPEKAYTLYLRAALRGEKQSVFEVGRCLFWGIGIKRDRRIAGLWFDRAEELGTYAAQDEEQIKKPRRNSALLSKSKHKTTRRGKNATRRS